MTAKGTPASGTETLDSLMTKIANISTGKKWASGSVSSTRLDVTGLPFKPSIIIVEVGNSRLTYVAGGDSTLNTRFADGTQTISCYEYLSVKNDGFSVKFQNYFSSIVHKWTAFE